MKNPIFNDLHRKFDEALKWSKSKQKGGYLL